MLLKDHGPERAALLDTAIFPERLQRMLQIEQGLRENRENEAFYFGELMAEGIDARSAHPAILSIERLILPLIRYGKLSEPFMVWRKVHPLG